VLWTLKEYATEECRPLLQAAFAQPTSDEVGKVRADWGKTKEDRVIAAWGLGKMGDKAAISFLVQMLDDPDVRHSHGFSPGVSLRAAQALSDIFGWDFVWHRDSMERVRCRVQERS
jgi:HEAT repeat protein